MEKPDSDEVSSSSQKFKRKSHNIPEKFLAKSTTSNEGPQSISFKDNGPKVLHTSSTTSHLDPVQKSSDSVSVPQNPTSNFNSLSVDNSIISNNNNNNNKSYKFECDVQPTKGVKRTLQLSPTSSSVPSSPKKKINLFGSKGLIDLDFEMPNPNPNPN
jgi:hypothetical protein